MYANRPTVVFCTATQSIIDYVYAGRGETEAQAIARLLNVYGTALVAMPADQAQQLYEARFKTPVSEITLEQFEYALNVLPPFAWTRARGAQSFKISERTAGVVTAIYVEMRDRYFTFQDDIRTPHDACCERVAAFIAENPVPAIKPEASA
jgi:hypothetical protein